MAKETKPEDKVEIHIDDDNKDITVHQKKEKAEKDDSTDYGGRKVDIV